MINVLGHVLLRIHRATSVNDTPDGAEAEAHFTAALAKKVECALRRAKRIP
jgi:hypothetical protein